ncbi:PfkB family carbohydrate kinase [Xylanimonas protaetiae]|uniref:PfkB family carbohydrate kinase n=1 Tax=Xylanimonas protaetiae TaxID=2509457 RepID=UPI00247813E0|nr:PfkB family carbohydrate kinase [Xylanimonas protaetiae]
MVRVAGVKVDVADTIGAGDTFMGALLDALAGAGAHGPRARSVLEDLTPEQLAEAASWAARAAAVTVSRPGADPPTRADLGA